VKILGNVSAFAACASLSPVKKNQYVSSSNLDMLTAVNDGDLRRFGLRVNRLGEVAAARGSKNSGISIARDAALRRPGAQHAGIRGAASLRHLVGDRDSGRQPRSPWPDQVGHCRRVDLLSDAPCSRRAAAPAGSWPHRAKQRVRASLLRRVRPSSCFSPFPM